VSQLGLSGPIPIPSKPSESDLAGASAAVVEYVKKSQKVFKHLDNLGVNTTGQSKAKVEVNQGDLEALQKAADKVTQLEAKLEALLKAAKPATDENEEANSK